MREEINELKFKVKELELEVSFLKKEIELLKNSSFTNQNVDIKEIVTLLGSFLKKD